MKNNIFNDQVVQHFVIVNEETGLFASAVQNDGNVYHWAADMPSAALYDRAAADNRLKRMKSRAGLLGNPPTDRHGFLIRPAIYPISITYAITGNAVND